MINKMNIYNFLRLYMNTKYITEPKDFRIWEGWFKAQYLNACISFQARARSLGDNTVFAQRQIKLVSDVAFQEKVWNYFLEVVDRLYKERQEHLLVHKQAKQGIGIYSILNYLIRSCAIIMRINLVIEYHESLGLEGSSISLS